ncbi:response regulator [Macrococcoides bohemicum]|uniref:DNA-binding response regulator n=2 Tax=Macrococcoides bohemicum TaxID=1903056 RepID=A0A328A505_9STAP|nr:MULTISPECIES: response regulator transcription factor [Macrococcus]ATD31226.1 DNA-binding response regulator [Macrococcus sp. IME1552]RAK49611.1 DNA-binding response regulator [Macrococcus bohemicus]TDL36017.1 response regulator transcription factor [Macrococcus bohemicus]
MKLLHAEDQSMLREAMKKLLVISGTFDEIVSVSNGAEAINVIDDSFDIALLDIEMPEQSGLDVLAYIREQKLDVKVIIVTTFKRPGYFERAVNLDVDAYVLKERSVDELTETIHSVMQGKKEYSPELLPLMLTKNPLTDKEQEILKLIGEGLTSKEISQKLFLSDGTVRNYTSIILEKLGADNRVLAWKMAKELGFID